MYKTKSFVKPILPYTIPLSLLLGISVTQQVLGLQFNNTGSMPIGFYRAVKTDRIRRSDIVAVCLPKKLAQLGLARGYLTHRDCPGNAAHLLKKVIAIPEDKVKLDDEEIIVNGTHYYAPIQSRDHHGRAVDRFVENGVYAHTRFYWLYGASDPVNSWDSRYFGGVRSLQGVKVYKPLWIMFKKSSS